MIFTASKKEYADVILDFLDPENKFIVKRLYRESCILINKMYVKDLRIFSNRELKNIVIVDNCEHSFWHNLSNGIPIISFY